MSSNDKSIPLKPKYKGGRYCCVVNCHSLQGREDCRFSRFPKRNLEQAELWRKAIHRVEEDGSPWYPHPRDVICGLHFILREPSNIRTNPDYVPSIFPTFHKKPKSEADIERHKRALKRAFPSEFESKTQVGDSM